MELQDLHSLESELVNVIDKYFQQHGREIQHEQYSRILQPLLAVVYEETEGA